MPTSRADVCFDQDSIKKRACKEWLTIDLRKREGKAASLSQASACYPDVATHGPGQRLGNRQTNAGAAEGARARLVDAIEAFKDVRELLGGKTNTRIGDPEGHHCFLAACSHLHATRCRCVAQRIDQEVRENLHGASRIGHDLREVFRQMDVEFKPFLGKLPLQRLKCALDEALWGNRL